MLGGFFQLRLRRNWKKPPDTHLSYNADIPAICMAVTLERLDF
jgi:hypothetical protein